MKKALIIIAVIAVLGVIAAYSNPLGPERHSIATTGAAPTAVNAVASSVASTPASNAPSSPQTTTTASGYKDGTFQGSDYTNRYGDVQVSITLQTGKITAIHFDQLTAQDGHSQEINDYAGPILKSQALSAQSSQIDGVSGATFTSMSYEQSLQSALDKAKA